MPRKLLVFALLLAWAWAQSALAAQLYPDRWVFVMLPLTRDEHVAKIRDIVRTAAAHGLNGMVLSAGFDSIDLWDKARIRRLLQVRDIAAQAGIEIIPLGFSIGYAGGILAHNPNLAAGLPVRNALFVVRGGQATLRPDPPVSIENGGFERFSGNNFAGFRFHDSPGQITFADTKIRHSGRASMRFENFGSDPHGHGRVMAEVKVSPYRHYLFSVWLKTENLQPRGCFNLLVIGANGRRLSYGVWPAPRPTQDWTRVAVTFNSLDNSAVRLYAGVWGGKSGRFWLDDMQIQEVGLRCVLRRPGTPMTVKSEDGRITYVEGRDFAPISDPKLRDFKGLHDDPPIKILPGSRIRDGQRLRVSFYHGLALAKGQVSACMSEPEVYEIWRKTVPIIERLLHPRKYLLSMDEIRQGGTCAACHARKARGMTMAQILGDCITRQCRIIRSFNPRAKIYIWSDMLDPNHNAHAGYYLVDGDYTGSWKYIPKDLVIACWYYRKRHQSLRHFSSLGFEILAAAYYDADNLDNVRGWLEALSNTPRVRGIMYTTWRQKYELLAAFGDLICGRAK